MFAWKSMDGNSNLMKLKLDMVYRNLSEEMASQAFTEITHPVLPAIEVKEPAKEPVKQPSEKPKVKKKIVKAALPKSK
jgi:hypothetical protein